MRQWVERRSFLCGSIRLAALSSAFFGGVVLLVLFGARLLRADALEIAFVRTDYETTASPLLIMDVSYGYTLPVSRVTNYGAKVWSPDGQVLASILQGEPLTLTQLDAAPHISTISENIWGAAWSPDGTKIAFVQARTDGYLLVTANVDGTNEQPIGSSRTVYGLAWSPDGRQLVYAARDGIFAIHADGTHERQLGVYQGYFPTWSPDGERIAFQVIVDQQAEIFTIAASGTSARRLTFNDRHDSPAGWVWRDAQWQVLALTARNGAFVMHIIAGAAQHGQEQSVPLLADPHLRVVGEPTISTDGRWVLFSATAPDIPNSSGIYQVGSDGRNFERLTDSGRAGSDILPIWR